MQSALRSANKTVMSEAKHSYHYCYSFQCFGMEDTHFFPQDYSVTEPNISPCRTMGHGIKMTSPQLHASSRTGNAVALCANIHNCRDWTENTDAPWAVAAVLCLCKLCSLFCLFGVVCYSSSASRARAKGKKNAKGTFCYLLR